MLVDDNASGKTSVLEALALQANVATEDGRGAAAMFHDSSLPEDLLRRGSKGPVLLRSSGTGYDDEGDNVRWQTTFELDLGPKTSSRGD